MPEVVRESGWVGSFYSNDGHEPPHIHLFKGGGQAKFWFKPVRLDRQHFGLKPKELAAERKIVEAHEDEILQAWNVCFGN